MMAEGIDIQTYLQQKWLVFGLALTVGVWVLAIARWQGFFKSFQNDSYYPLIHGKDVLMGFGFFILAQLLVMPTLIGLAFLLAGMDFSAISEANPQVKGLLNLLIILGGFGSVFLAYLTLTPIQQKQLWHQSVTPWYRHVGMGVLACLISYPIVLAFSEGLSLVLWHYFQPPPVEQVAVQNVRHTLSSPFLFGLTALSIVTLVPLTEEFLFRGLLQSWLRRKIQNAPIAIGLSSLIFALFHYSKQHGITNIELLSSLFLLSCMLGYVYERQRSLWAPVGLHGFFNLISLLMIFQVK